MGKEMRSAATRSRALLAIVALTALAVLGLAPQAAGERVGGGTIRLDLDRGLLRDLSQDGVRLDGGDPGKQGGRSVARRVSGGQLDFATARGEIKSNGNVRFRTAEGTLAVRRLELDTANLFLRATIAGRTMRIAVLEGFSFVRQELREKVDAKLRMTAAAATLLNRRLGTSAFRPGRALGSASARVQPDLARVAGGSFRLEFDAGTVAKLESLGLELVLYGSQAPPSQPPVFEAPVADGWIDPRSVRTGGWVDGGFAIARQGAPGPRAEWSKLFFSYELTGLGGGRSRALDSFGRATPAPPPDFAGVELIGDLSKPGSRTFRVGNVRALVDEAFAAYVNGTFVEPLGKPPIFNRGDPLGTFSITMQAR